MGKAEMGSDIAFLHSNKMKIHQETGVWQTGYFQAMSLGTVHIGSKVQYLVDCLMSLCITLP